MPKKPEFVMCAHCEKKIEKKSHNQKYCIPCVDVIAKIKRDKKKEAELAPKKNERHQQYKRQLCNMLLNFYVDVNVKSILTENQLTNFIKNWVDKHVRSPVEDWNPMEDE